MIRVFAFSSASVALLALAAASQAAAEGTIRIETRPFYGAVVTLEEGVRVFRPLPADEYVIINPDGKTPLNLSLQESNVYEQRLVKNYNYGRGGSGAFVRSYGGGGFFVPPFGFKNSGPPANNNNVGGIAR